MEGAEYIAKCLKQQGVKDIFGIVGVPITPIADACQSLGIHFYGFRNEQSAGYAASVYGYLTKKPGCCLTVSGPGMLHALPGILNATGNCWPMMLISSSPDRALTMKGAFQEGPQLPVASLYSKYAAQVHSLEKFPYILEQATRASIYGKPGGVYIELPADVITSKIEEAKMMSSPSSSVFSSEFELIPAHQKYIDAAISLLVHSSSPLVIIGKGAAYARADLELLKFLEKTNIPFLASPMGKGVVPDTHPLCVGASRSLALKKADVIMVVGARMNWMFGFGQAPQFSDSVKFIKVDISAETIHDNVRADVPLIGDAKVIIDQLTKAASDTKIVNNDGAWFSELRQKNQANKEGLEKQCKDDTVPMIYHRVFSEISKYINDNTILVNEGANTMDIGRLVLQNTKPHQRLDAGTLGTMGVGLGYSIAASVACPDKKIIAVQGDSAFGFSGMELETICRYNLPICVIIVNNNGIYTGLATHTPGMTVPTTSLLPNCRYEKIIEAFGGKGFYATNPKELEDSSKKALEDHKDEPTCVNIMIKPEGALPKIIQTRH
eukprot:TRINITY_DN7365_c0_g1_i1.p1 TRINITY_DN7365_c0_g1~~TRINITY_DN7365_c0_g1_i1.p1  ORF type:complete len:552 (+),score=172.41 TRINITY_DN7365_c0_g1_i1:97-1752(+)